jgi:CubicO group peptidase (beta-lactamase class C family)
MTWRRFFRWAIILFILWPLVSTIILYWVTRPLPAKTFTGMAAKLLCSAHYVSGFSTAQAKADLSAYSSAFLWQKITFNPVEKSVTASIPYIADSTAKYRPISGCTLENGDTSQLDELKRPHNPAPMANEQKWPAGTQVTPNPQLQQWLDKIMALDTEQAQHTRALVVIHNGQLVAESYQTGIHPDTPLLGWSMGKGVIGLMIGQQVSQGNLSLEQTGLFADWAKDPRQHISLQQMLRMTSGLDFIENYTPGAGASNMLFASPTPAQVPMAATLDYSPSRHFQYSSGTTNLLSKLLFELAGGTAQDFMDHAYTEFVYPLGLRHTTLELAPSGLFVGSSYMYASARDWARIGWVIANKGRINHYPIVSAQWITAASQPNLSTNNPSFGYHLWLNLSEQGKAWPDLPDDAVAFRGDRQQMVMIIPSQQLVLVRLGWSSKPYPFNQRISSIMDQLKTQERTQMQESNNQNNE